MTTSKHIAIALATVFALGIAGEAAAQKAGKRKGKGWEKKREKIRQKIRTMRAWRLTEALDLDEKTAGKLFPIINDYDEKFAKIAKKSRQARRQLRKELESTAPDKKKLNKLVDSLEKQHQTHYEWQRDRFKAVRKVLTPEQAAKIIVLLPELDRQIRQQIRKAMRGGRDGKRRRKPRDDFKDPF